MASPKKGLTNAQATAQTKSALLKAGARLVVEESDRSPFSQLRVRAICEAAGKTTGAFFAHWKNMEEYRDELFRLLQSETDAWSEDFAKMRKTAARARPDQLARSIARLADQDIELVLANPLWDAMELLQVTWGRTRFRDESVAAYRDGDRDTAAVYGRALASANRSPRAPLTDMQVGALLQALVEGMALRHRIDPEALEVQLQAAQSLYAVGVAALLAILTCVPGDDDTVDEVLTKMLDA